MEKIKATIAEAAKKIQQTATFMEYKSLGRQCLSARIEGTTFHGAKLMNFGDGLWHVSITFKKDKPNGEVCYRHSPMGGDNREFKSLRGALNFISNRL